MQSRPNLKLGTGPAQLLRFGLLTMLASSPLAHAQSQTCFDYTGAIENWQVPEGVSTLTVEGWGASGGDSTWGTPRAGGLGAYIAGDVTVTPGETLKILVGGTGETGSVGGGGGGTYLATLTDTPLLVAGGGGGASSDEDGIDAVTTESGTDDSLGLVAGGTGGNGGGACGLDRNDGGGGGGFLTDGATANSGGPSTVGGFGGSAFVNGGTIALPGRLDGACTAQAGGFGGGGSTSCNTVGGGGGGGYSGGAGGAHISNCGASVRAGGGGGGSFNSGINQTNTAGVQTGDGRLCITPGIAVLTYSVGGTVSGLTGAGLELQNNGGDTLPVATDGPFTFVTELDDGADYAVTVSAQPLGQTCSVSNGGGTIASADITDVSIQCADTAPVAEEAPPEAVPVPALPLSGIGIIVFSLLAIARRRLA